MNVIQAPSGVRLARRAGPLSIKLALAATWCVPTRAVAEPGAGVGRAGAIVNQTDQKSRAPDGEASSRAAPSDAAIVSDPDSSDDTSGATPPSDDAADADATGVPAEPQYSAWQTDHASLFVSLATDFGVVYARPRLTLGYGAPFWNYVGLDAHWIVTNSFTAPYIGWRASLPFLDVTMGVRRTLPFDRRFVSPRASHDGDSLAVPQGGERDAYTAIDFEVAAVAPIGQGGAFLSAHPVYLNVSEEHHVFDEVLRAVMKPPFAVGFRGGYVVGLDAQQTIQVGAGAEYVLLPGRPKNVTRAGPIVHLTFSRALEGFFVFSAVVDSPDTLGVVHGSYAFLGLLHRFAERF